MSRDSHSSFHCCYFLNKTGGLETRCCFHPLLTQGVQLYFQVRAHFQATDVQEADLMLLREKISSCYIFHFAYVTRDKAVPQCLLFALEAEEW